MELTRETIGMAAGVLALAGYLPYIISILRRKTQPNRATWLIWTIVGGLLALSFFAEGDPKAIWLPIGYFVGPLLVALLSIRYGYAAWTRLDTFCLIAAIMSIVPLVLLKNATSTLLINVALDATGAVPTLAKTYAEPETEDLTAWLIFLIANTLQLFTITEWNLASIYPIYLFFLAAAMVVFILRGKLIKRV